MDGDARDKLRAAAWRAAHTCPRCGSNLPPARAGRASSADEWPTLGYRDCNACGYKAVTALPKNLEETS